MPDPKTNVNKEPRLFFRYVGNKTFYFSSKKKRIFCPKTSKFSPKLAFLPGLAGSFDALLVGWLVVVARGLYLARHLFTLSYILPSRYCIWKHETRRIFQLHYHYITITSKEQRGWCWKEEAGFSFCFDAGRQVACRFKDHLMIKNLEKYI